MYCIKCGKDVPEGAAHCASCGTPLGELAESPLHRLNSFPIWALVLLHYVTFGIFSIVWLNIYHGKMPKRRPDDPSAGKAVGFLFIPFYNLYWLFVTHIRLCERLGEERKNCGLEDDETRSLAIVTCVLHVIPCINYLSLFAVYPIFASFVQASVNEIVRVGTRSEPAPGALCPACMKENPVGTRHCDFCGIELVGRYYRGNKMEFHGTGLQYIGWSLWAALLSYLVIPAAWGYTSMWRWFVRSIRFSDGTSATYHRNATEVWGACALLGLLSLVQLVLQYMLPEVANNENLVYLGYVMPVLLSPATIALFLYILRRFVSGVELSTGSRPSFNGNYGKLLGWWLLVYVSVFSIVGWCWAVAAATRWICSQLVTSNTRLNFQGKGHQILWRVIVAYLLSCGIITIPWAIRWLLRWLAENVIVVRTDAS